MEVYVVRHGKTDWNKEYRFQGAHDIPLNQEGREAALVLGKRLSSLSFDAIFSSPLERAYETACLVRDQSLDEKTRALKVVTDERITEVSFGELEGLPFDEWMNTREPRKYFFKEPGRYVPPKGGETFESGIERTGDFLHKVLEPIYKKNPAARIFLVAHGAILAALMCNLEKRGVENYWGKGLKGNCEETIYSYDGKNWTLTSEEKAQENPYMKFAENEEERAILIKKENPDSLSRTVEVLKKGGIVIIPTDTVYGFSGIVDLKSAASHYESDGQIGSIKGRAESKPLIQLIAKPQDLRLYTDEEIPESLLAKWPGPLTIIVRVKKASPLADTAIPEAGTIAFRCPGDQWLRKIIEETGAPIFSTSVNRSGQQVLDTEAAIIKEFASEVNLIVTDGDKKGAKPSTIVSLTDGKIEILRQGDVIIE